MLNLNPIRRRGQQFVLAAVLLAISVFITPATGYGGDDASSAHLTWDDAPAPAPVRHLGDAALRWGWVDEADVFGPFSPADEYIIGDRVTFYLGTARRASFDVELRHISQHAYFWFEPSIPANEAAVNAAAARFDGEIWPLGREAFGKVNSPGIDGDERIHLVHMANAGSGLIGFFRPSDQCSAVFCPGSNEWDALYMINAYGPVDSEVYYATLIHEFQHLIRFNLDGNEYRWLDEGLSELAEALYGFEDNLVTAQAVQMFLESPNIQLNGWSLDLIEQGAHYGAGYLFSLYLYERFGLEFIQALSRNPLDGLAAVHEVLQTLHPESSLEEVVLDWHIANYLDKPNIAAGQYGYDIYNLPDLPRRQLMEDVNGGQVNQYGVQYILLDQPGEYLLNFNGDAQTPIVPIEPHSGDWMWWSNNAVASATSLTRTVDLQAVDQATLEYAIWWQTGDFPGYLHVLASPDGQVWEPLQSDYMRPVDPYRLAPGPAYSGRSGEWLVDEIDLSLYAGQEVTIRFEAITDREISGPGFVIDDIHIPEIGFVDDVEQGEEEWVAEGFLRTSGMVQQDWGLALVTLQNEPEVDYLPVSDGQVEEAITVSPSGALLVMVPMAPFTQLPATYTLEFEALHLDR
jgi:hypothetical protein